MHRKFILSLGAVLGLTTMLYGQAGSPPSTPSNPAKESQSVAPQSNAPDQVAPANDSTRVTTQNGSVQVQTNQPANVQPGQPANVQSGQPGHAQQQGQLFRAKQILGSKVQLSGNVAAGTVDDFVVDEAGYVEYVIVNNNNQFVTVPWDAAQFNFEKQTAVINIQQEQFKKIPTFTADKYPVFSEPQYRTTVYRSYGLTPRDRPAILPRNRRP